MFVPGAMIWRVVGGALLVLPCSGMLLLRAVGQTFTLQQALSAPFSNGLTAAPAKARVAWVTDAEGRRNVWVAGAHEAARQVSRYTEDDGQDVDGLAWSADGERVAWTRGTGAQGPEHPVANPAELPGPVRQVVVFADLQTGLVRAVAEGHSPLFARDGRSLFFLRQGNIWTVPLDGAAGSGGGKTAGQVVSGVGALNSGRPDLPCPDVGGSSLSESTQAASVRDERQLLYVRGVASGLRLSPDGTRLLFVSGRGDHSFIGVYTLGAGTLRWIDPGVDFDHDAVWSPDGRSVAFVREVPIVSPIADRWMRVGAPWSIRVADAATGKGKEVWRADTGAGSLFHGVAAKDQVFWTANGRIVFPWEKGGWTRLYAVSVQAAVQTPGQAKEQVPMPSQVRPVLLTPGDFEVDGVAPSGDTVLFSANDTGADPVDADRRHVWLIDVLHGGAPEALTRGAGIETEPVVLSDGKPAMMAGGVAQPLVPVLFVSEGKLQAFAPALVPARFPARQFVAPQAVVFPAADGLPIHGQLFLPPGAAAGARLPAVVFFHGGSRRQMLLGFHPMQYYAQAYEFNQYLASRGFAVLSVNYRSGTGYGLNFRQALSYGANGGSEDNDAVGAANYLASRADIDAKRIGAWGGSYGGYLTALALARHSDRYAAGVDLHGVHDWSLELDLWKPTDEPGVDQAAVVRRAFLSSPMADVDRWKSPVLLVQGDDDRNVLFAQTVRLAAELHARQVPVEVLVLPDEVHDFLLRRDWVEVYGASEDFLRRKLMQ